MTATHLDMYTKEQKAPYCSNILVCLHNSLATVGPDAIQYWNHSRNGISPQQVFAGSSGRL